MANKTVGRIYSISATENIPTKSGNTFTKREVILDVKNTYNGQEFHNYPKFEMVGNELCQQLDTFRNNDLVTVYFDLSGNNYTDAQGNVRNFTRVRGWKIEMWQKPEQTTLEAPQQSATPQPQVQQTSPFPPQQTSMFGTDDMPF
jgi:hypothetical protein